MSGLTNYQAAKDAVIAAARRFARSTTGDVVTSNAVVEAVLAMERLENAAREIVSSLES